MHSHTGTAEVYVLEVFLALKITHCGNVLTNFTESTGRSRSDWHVQGGCSIPNAQRYELIALQENVLTIVGAYWVCPPNIPHLVRAVTDCTLLHIFSGAPVDVKPQF
jgi:hypothetical protein